MRKFYDVKLEFDNLYKNKDSFTAIVPVNLTINKQCKIKGKNNDYSKQFIIPLWWATSF